MKHHHQTITTSYNIQANYPGTHPTLTLDSTPFTFPGMRDELNLLVETSPGVEVGFGHQSVPGISGTAKEKMAI